jgi:hypothetical protein
MPASPSPPRARHCGSDYDRARARHVFQRDAYLGGDHFRTPSRTTLSTARAWRYGLDENGQRVTRQERLYATYLVPHAAESDESFEARLHRACYLNLVAPIVDSYAESVTAHVTREIPESYGDMADVDARGSAWGDHVEEVARWAALYGYVAAVYDAPAANPARNRAEEQALGIGPRVVVVEPLAWAWVEVDDDGRLVTFAYVEQSVADETGGPSAVTGMCDVTVRVWTLAGGDDGATAEWQVARAKVQASQGLAAQRGAFKVEARGPLPPALGGELPVVIAYYRRMSGSRFPVGQPVADDAVDIARSIYNKLSEEDELHTKAGFPFLAIPKANDSGLEPDVKMSIGPGRGIAYAAGSGAPAWVQPSAESPRELRESVVFRAAMAFRLAGIEVATDQGAQAESGVALRVRARGFEARAKRFANAMSRYERAGLRLWAKLAGSSEDASIAYAKRFTLPDPTEDLAAAISLLTQVPVEIGVDAKVAVVRKALDAVLALSEDEMARIVDEVRSMLEADKADFDDARKAGAAERAAKLRGLSEDDDASTDDAGGRAPGAQPDGDPDAAERPAGRPPARARRGARKPPPPPAADE